MKTNPLLIIVVFCLLGCNKQMNNESLPEHGLLWQIRGNGVSAPSYLFGTAHTPEAIHIIDSIQKFKSAFSSTFQFICEILPDSTEMTNPFYPQNNEKLLNFLKPWPVADSTYASLLTHTQQSIIDSACKANVNIHLIEWGNLRPIEAINFLKTIKRVNGNVNRPKRVISKALPEPDKDSSKIIILDYYLLNQAKLYQMKTFGLETIEERNIIIDSILKHIPQLSYREEVDLFIYYLENNQKIDSLNDINKRKFMRLYFRQNLDSMTLLVTGINTNMALINRWRGYDDSEIIQNLLIDKRNELWMQRIPDFIQNTSSFIAVGARHLGGEKGLINQLRKLDYEVIPIEEVLFEP